MRKNATQFYFTRVPFLSTTVVCHYTYSCGVRRSPAHPRLIRRFLTIRSGYLPRLCRNCKHFYPTLHHLLITCPSNFLKGARKTLRDDLRDAISSPLRSQLQALLPGFLGRIDFLLLDWDMQDFG